MIRQSLSRMERRPNFNLRSILCLGVPATIAVVLVLLTTRHGAGVSPDSVVYLHAAHSVLEGRGLLRPDGSGAAEEVPMTHWPPLFPLVLAGLGSLSIEPIHAARWLNAVLFGANVFLVGLVIHRMCGSVLAALAGALLAMMSREMISYHQMVWTEPIFIYFFLVSLYLLFAYVEMPKRQYLLLAALTAGGAFLTRYQGAGLVLGGCGALLIQGRTKWRRRVVDTFVFGLVATLPIAVWFLRNYSMKTRTTYSNPRFGLPKIDQLVMPIFTAVRDWFWPVPSGLEFFNLAHIHWRLQWPGLYIDEFLAALAILGVIGLAISLNVGKRRSGGVGNTPDPPDRPSFPVLLALTAIGHCVFLYATVLTLFHNWTPKVRHLAPVMILLLIVLVHLVRRWWLWAPPRATARFFTAVIVMVVTTGIVGRATVLISWTSCDGHQYASSRWKSSPVIAATSRIPLDAKLYTNNPMVLRFLTDRTRIQAIPRMTWMGEDLDGAKQAALLESLRRHLADGAMIVLFENDRPYMSRESLEASMPLRVFVEAEDGLILAWNPKAIDGTGRTNSTDAVRLD